MLERLGLRLRFALFFAALGLGGVLIFCTALWLGWSRGGDVSGYVLAGIVGGFGLLGLAAWVGLLFDENVARPILALAAELHTRAQSNVATEIDAAPARYLGALAPAAQAIHAELEAVRAQQAATFAEKTARMARDKALLEALIRDLTDAVIVVSPDRKTLLYNQSAAQLLGKIGLNRPIGSALRLAPVEDALARYETRGDDPDAEPFLTTTSDGEAVLTGAVLPVWAGEERVGDVLMLRDATEELRTHASLTGLLRETIEGARRPAMAMAAMLDVMGDAEKLAPDDRQRFRAGLREETARLSAHLADVARRESLQSGSHWPMEEIDAGAIGAALAARHDGGVVDRARGVRLYCDGFAITSVLDRVLRALAEGDTRTAFVLSAEKNDADASLVLSWTGPTLPQGDLEERLRAPISEAYGPFTCRDALDAHRTDIWSEAGSRIVLPLKLAGTEMAPRRLHRTAVYDFQPPKADGAMLDCQLDQLSYVVFDTETTGLDPKRDDVVQIAGIRLLGARILDGEVFDRLVSPGRSIPAASTVIHGITDEMVAGEPGFDVISRAFHDFSEGAVLVAHNAAFDMAFLQRAGGFDHPALCTARLSAAIHNHTGEHTLDALADRFGITIEDAVRHTALGDAIATAEVFNRLLPLLRSFGVVTLGDALKLQGSLA